MQSAPHPVLGRLVHVRKGSITDIVGAIIFGVPAMLSVVTGLYTFGLGVVELFRPTPNASSQTLLIGGASATLVGGGLALLSVFLLRRGRAHVRFYELGAVQIAGKRSVELPYADVTRFTYALVRQYYQGMYVGTTLKFRIRDMDARRSINISGRFKAKDKGSIFNRKYQATDAMERVKDVIAEQMCDTFSEQMLRGTPINWCGVAELTPDGVRLKRGRLKNQLIPYEQFASQTVRNGVYRLVREGDKRACIKVAVNTENFQPAHALFQRLSPLPPVEEPTPSGLLIG